MKAKILLFTIILSKVAWGQSDSVPDTGPTIQCSGFIDAFYSYDFAQPISNRKQPFFYNHNRHNELSLNLAMVRVGVDQEHTRGAVALMAGTYAQDNLAHEEDLMQHVFEAWGGAELYKGLWLEAGIFGSHIGFESAISSDNLTLTRSLMAENSPYYLSGAKLSYEAIDKWTFRALVTNGWQNISEPWFNENKAIGTQVTFEPSDRFLINYSTLISDEGNQVKSPLRPQGERIFNDVYIIFSPVEKLQCIVAADLGMEWYDDMVETKEWRRWYAPAFLLGYDWSERFSTGLRGEYYNDPHEVIIQTGTPNGFQTWGASMNVDYHSSRDAVLRVELRYLETSDAIYQQKDFSYSTTNLALTTSLAVRFGN